MIPLGTLNRPPDKVTKLYSCSACKRIAGGEEEICSKCKGPTTFVGTAGLWMPQVDVASKIESMQKEIEELKKKQ